MTGHRTWFFTRTRDASVRFLCDIAPRHSSACILARVHMDKSKRTRILKNFGLSIALFFVAFGAAPGVAASHARVEGAVSVRTEVIAEQNTQQPVGTVTTRTWTFTPECATGGCVTRLDRVRNTSPRVTTYQLKPRQTATGELVYRATIRAVTDCFDESGAVLFEDGMQTVERVEVKTRRVNAQNVAQKVKGRLRAEFTPTAAAAAVGCDSGFTELTFKSVGAFAS